MEQLTNLLSFDLEYWGNNEFVSDKYKSDKDGSKESEELVTSPVNQILTLLAKHNTKTTFFVVGELAKRHPDLIRKIQQAGHEIACHSYHIF